MTQQRVIRVLVAEDEPPLREAICDLIASEPGMEIVGAAESATQAIALAEAMTPDVAVVDVRMPGGGPDAVRGIRERSPGTSLLALSAYEDQATVLEMLRAGAIGYLVKGISPLELVDAIRRASRGQASLSIDVIAGVVDELVRDVAQTRQADEVKRESEERFRQLLESAPDGVVVVDEAGTIVVVNAQTETLFGYARDELLGQPVEMLLTDSSSEGGAAHRAGDLAGPHIGLMAGGLELSGRHRDGTEFPAEISLSAVETSAGRLAIALVRDVSERKRAEELRRQGEERFRELLELAPDGAVVVDEAGTIVLVNPQTETLFGYTRDELLGRPVELLLPAGIREHQVEHRADYLADPPTLALGIGLELVGRRQNGTEFPVDISVSVSETSTGRLATAFVRDVSGRKHADQLERDLLQRDLADRRSLLAHLVAAGEEERARIADDIHDDSIQVITAAGMRLQILRRTIEDPEQLRLLDEFEKTIQLSIARLRHLLFELRPPVLDNDGLSAALELYLDEADDETTATYRLDDELTSQPSLETRTILYRIVQEALVNARKHAQAANVVVALRERDDGYHVCVSDDGVGFVVDSSAPLPGHLGLRAMRERATLAGGWLRIDAAPGRGTTVEAWVPRPVRSGAPQNGALQNSAQQNGAARAGAAQNNGDSGKEASPPPAPVVVA
jgi:PAS domain S-box-containing protein